MLIDEVLDRLKGEDHTEALDGESWGERYVKDFMPDGIDVKCVEQEGGGEGDGSHVYAVYSFSRNQAVTRGIDLCYVCFKGYYASYHGSEYEEHREVTPKEVTITQYVRV